MAFENLSAAQETSILISSISDLIAPDVKKKLGISYPNQVDFGIEFMEQMGNYEPITNQVFKNHEENRLMNAAIIGSKATASAASVVITLDPSSVATVNGQFFSEFRVGDRVEFANAHQGIVTAVSKPTGSVTHTMTIGRSNATYDMDASCIPGDYLTNHSYAGFEGMSGPTEAIIPTTRVFTNSTQIFYDMHRVTSTQEGNETFLEFTYPEGHPKAGQKGRGYFIKGEADMVNRFKKKRALGLFTNDNGSVVDGNGDTRTTSRGFIPFLKSFGNLADYISAPTMSTLDTIALILNKNYGSMENIIGHGINAGLGLKNFSTELFKNGGVVYGSNGEGIDSAKLGMKTLEYSTGHKFHFKPINILNDADSTGAPGRAYPDMMIVMPVGKTRDVVTGDMENYFSIRYNTPKAGTNVTINKSMRVWEQGGNAPTPTGNDLARRINITSEEGLQVYGSKTFILLTKKANS